MKPYVMDSSAALAILLNEKGTDIALGFAPDAQCSSVNAAEVIAKLIDRGRSMEEAAYDLASLGIAWRWQFARTPLPSPPTVTGATWISAARSN